MNAIPAASIQQRALHAVSPAAFARDMLLRRIDPKDNTEFIVAEHHREWDKLVRSSERLCVNAPRDHGKSFFFDFAVPIWKAWHQPNGRGFIFSASQDQAIRILSDIKDEIEDNPLLSSLMPKRKEMWNVTSVRLANGHRIYARGYGTKIRGAHPQWIVVDDGLNDEDAYSEVTRNKHIEYFYTAITNMVVPDGQIIVVGTPFHASDLYADLARNEAYTFRSFPALDASGKPLWPGRYNQAKLLQRRKEIGAVRFTREFLCQPISDDMSLFPGHLFEGQPVQQFNAVLGASSAFWKSVGIRSVFIGVDLAISASTAADFTCVFVMGLDGHGNRWVMDIQRAKGLSFQRQLSLIHTAAKKYDADLIFVEANQMQRVFGDELIRTTDLPIKKFVTTGSGKANKAAPKGNTTSANKNTLEGGVPALRVLLENGKVRIPRGDKRSVELTDEWISEMRAFTYVDGKLQGVGAHDDTVMAFWIAEQAVKQGGFSFTTGNENEEGDLASLLRDLTGGDEEEKADKDDDKEEADAPDADADKAAAAVLGSDEMSRVTADLMGDDAPSSAVESAWSALARFGNR